MKILNVTDRTIETQKGTVAKKYIDTVLWLENGKKFPYREQSFIDKEETTYQVIMPKSSRKIVYVLNFIGCHEALLLKGDQKPGRKTAILTVHLNKKQLDKLNRLKSLCSKA